MTDTTVLDRLDDIETLLKGLPVPEFVGLPFIAAKLGCSTGHLRNNPWLLPAHGISEVPGKLSWSLRTVRAWLEVSPVQHQSDWDALPPSAQAAVTAKRGKR